MPSVVAVRYLSGFKLWLRFSDGTEGEVDLASELWGPVFEPLNDREYFARVAVNPDLRTICWPNGADFAPEFLRSQVQEIPGSGL